MWSCIPRTLGLSCRSLLARRPANVVRHAIKTEGRALRFSPTAQRASPLHTTSTRQVGFFMTPVARVLVAVGGRITRSWWVRLSPERRKAVWAAISKRRKYLYGCLGLFCLGGAGYYYSHLETTPITGRRRFMMFSKKDILKVVEEEREFILKTVAKGKQWLPPSDPTYRKVLSIATTILTSNRNKWQDLFDELNWKLYVIDAPDIINAVCLPSGEIFVFTGLVNACRNEAELAFILSHEISHSVLGHGAEGLSHKGVIEFFGLFLIAAIWAVIPNDLVSYFLHRFTHNTAEVLFDYPYSRKLEMEADQVGLLFAANACFNPEEAAKIWTHLPNCNVDDQVVEYLSTHPCNERRYEMLSVLLPTAHAVWKEAECEEELKKEVKSFQHSVADILKKAPWW